MKMFIPLTAQQLKNIDEIALDKEVNDKTLRTALQYHSNNANRLRKEEKKFWRELADTHGLDLHNRKYRVSRGPVVGVEEFDEGDDEDEE